MRQKGKGTNRHEEEEYSWSSLHECDKKGRVTKGTRRQHGISKNRTQNGDRNRN